MILMSTTPSLGKEYEENVQLLSASPNLSVGLFNSSLVILGYISSLFVVLFPCLYYSLDSRIINLSPYIPFQIYQKQNSDSYMWCHPASCGAPQVPKWQFERASNCCYFDTISCCNQQTDNSCIWSWTSSCADPEFRNCSRKS